MREFIDLIDRTLNEGRELEDGRYQSTFKINVGRLLANKVKEHLLKLANVTNIDLDIRNEKGLFASAMSITATGDQERVVRFLKEVERMGERMDATFR